MRMLTSLFIAAVVLAFVQAYFSAEAKQAFKARCDAQQGTVLMSLTSTGGGWIRCYTGVKELYNEV